MRIFSKIFGRNSSHTLDPNIGFGRYSDSYKTDEKYDFWDKSVLEFENKHYHNSYKLFFEYLKDIDEKNVFIIDQGNSLEFTIFQGSKKITGYTTDKKIFAESKIARIMDKHIGFLRKLVEMNFNLRFSRFALDKENNITMVFNSFLLDTSPYKLYYALKELSTSSDKQDDILIKEFGGLQPVNTGHLRPIKSKEKETKFNFLIHEVQDSIKEYEEGKLNTINFPGGISYFLLSKMYKLDYLLKPEGKTMASFEKIHMKFFTNNGEGPHEKNKQIVKELKKISRTRREDFDKELYEVLSTFGVTAPTSHRQYITFADSELSKMDWYMDNKHPKIARSIPDYIVGYSLFNYALPAPLKKLLHCYYEILEPAFFKALEYNLNLRKGQTLNQQAIKKRILATAKIYNEEYPHYSPNVKMLDFTNDVLFSKSFIQMTRELNLTKISR